MNKNVCNTFCDDFIDNIKRLKFLINKIEDNLSESSEIEQIKLLLEFKNGFNDCDNIFDDTICKIMAKNMEKYITKSIFKDMINITNFSINISFEKKNIIENPKCGPLNDKFTYYVFTAIISKNSENHSIRFAYENSTDEKYCEKKFYPPSAYTKDKGIDFLDMVMYLIQTVKRL